ncbi:hypothetical protein P4H39_30380 [Paenibacillus lautus]|uniref:hypothetical protein n=1 Tax=Paenibacillus lautus TaxID=1401 RepID=UPI002DB8BE9F|nr:hypothetical protein [Paenibacillus lautus]MEC0206924.1 hypothetical protein [Paenibacillus lautus]
MVHHDQIKRINESSVLAYLNTLKPFFYWIEKKSSYKGAIVQWNGEPIGVKEAVRQYLIQEMHCKVRGRENHEGIYMTSKSSKTVQLFLAAIKGLYRSMLRMKMYPYENPLVDLEWEDNYGELPGARQNRPRMPQAAGTARSSFVEGQELSSIESR